MPTASMPAASSVTRLNLRAGDFVRVRSRDEILAMLDPDGTLDGLPFMPEMEAWCGRVFRVSHRADKTCDTVTFSGQRRMRDTVHLEGLRCDGSAHGGCQAGCLTFWKEAWLVRVRDESGLPAAAAGSAPPAVAGCTPDQLRAATRVSPPADGADDAEPVYSCQATRLLTASERLRWFDPRQYVREVRSGNVGLWAAILQTLLYLFNNVQNLSRRFLPERLRLRGGSWYPFVFGRLTKTPRETLDLAAGDRVTVKSHAEIVATLDTQGRNRGMGFDTEMVPYCGRTMTVLRRVERLIDEGTGRMRHLGSDALILDGAFCEGRYHGMCPREVYPYWREIWLRRADGQSDAGTPSPQAAEAGAGAPRAEGAEAGEGFATQA